MHGPRARHSAGIPPAISIPAGWKPALL